MKWDWNVKIRNENETGFGNVDELENIEMKSARNLNRILIEE
jgi:hypothetical protein